MLTSQHCLFKKTLRTRHLKFRHKQLPAAADGEKQQHTQIPPVPSPQLSGDQAEGRGTPRSSASAPPAQQTGRRSQSVAAWPGRLRGETERGGTGAAAATQGGGAGGGTLALQESPSWSSDCPTAAPVPPPSPDTSACLPAASLSPAGSRQVSWESGKPCHPDCPP